MTESEAIALSKSDFWVNMTPRERATFQLFEKRLCMPFAIFHEAMEATLKRPIFTHEFGLNIDGLKAELIGEKQPPTFTEIMELIPAEKRVLVVYLET